jgi:hypothetical protein
LSAGADSARDGPSSCMPDIFHADVNWVIASWRLLTGAAKAYGSDQPGSTSPPGLRADYVEAA